MKRAAVFAHYDKDSIIDDYVIYYIENLKKIADIVIFVSCNNLSDEEKMKLDVNHIISEEHKEYDFGSYKRGFFYLKENNLLNDIDELIFANDSCYAPLFPLVDMFHKMDNEQCDFWGVTEDKYGLIKNPRRENKYKRCYNPHLQSYFIVIKKQVIYSEAFNKFIENIKQETFKNDIIINYEIGLSNQLEANGFRYSQYIKSKYRPGNIMINKWKDVLVKDLCPFLKCSIIRGYNYLYVDINETESILESISNYPIDIIKNNLKRTKLPGKYPYLPRAIKIFYYYISRRFKFFKNNCF